MRVLTLALILGFGWTTATQAALSGTHRIGPTGQYVDLDAAVSALMAEGVEGAVQFVIEPGTYGPSDPAQAIINIDGPVPGASPTNRVTFRPDTVGGGTVDNVILERVVGSEMATDGTFVQIRSDYVTIRDLTMRYSDNSTTSRVDEAILVDDTPSNPTLQGVEIIGCKIFGNSGTSRLFAGFVCLTESHDFVLQDNEIDGAHNGLHFSTGWTYSALIQGNTVTGTEIWFTGGSQPLGEGVRLGSCDDVTITENVFDYSGGAGGHRAIEVFAGLATNITITRNLIKRVGAGHGVGPNDSFSGIYVFGASSGIIANNMVAGINTAHRTGIEVISDGVDVLHNTVLHPQRDSPYWTPNAAIRIDGTGNRILNNIIIDMASAGNLVAALQFADPTGNVSDYNDIYSTMDAVRSGNTQYPTLTAWQALGFDQNSISKPVAFVHQREDLHLADCSIGDDELLVPYIAEVTRDFDDQSRDVMTPFMGADESDGLIPSMFALPRVYPAGQSSWQFAAGDLDGDTDVDFAISNSQLGSDDITLLMNDGLGQFSAPQHVAFVSDSYSPRLAHLNDDTLLDLIVTTGGDAYFRINLGGGTFGALNVIPAIGFSPDYETALISDLAVGDLDADGDVDILASNHIVGWPDAAVYPWLNDGSGNFSVDLPVAAAGPFVDQVALADLNGDDLLDVIMVDAITNHKIYLSMNRGDDPNGAWLGFEESLVELPELVTSVPTRSTLLVGEFDGSSGTDIVIGDAFELDRIVVYANDGGGNFSSSSFSVHPTITPRTLAALDYDDDGYMDIIAANSTQDLTALLNDGAGGFDTKLLCVDTAFGATARGIVTADFDGDLALDVAVLSADDMVNVYSNLGWMPTAVGNPGGQNVGSPVLSGPRLGQNYPNPFNPVTTIQYELAEPGPVQLVIFDVRGRQVQTLVNERRPAGRYEHVWRGTDASGRAVASGVYFYRLVAPQGSYSRRMILVR